MNFKFLSFGLFKRSPFWSCRNYRFYSLSSAAQAEFPPDANRSILKAAEFESAICGLKNKLHPGRLAQVLDSMSDSNLAFNIFKWASTQKNFRATPETYAHMILKLGLAGNHEEMDVLFKEMVKLELPTLEEAVDFLIHSFCQNCRPIEALKVFEYASLANCRLSVLTCNALLGAFSSEEGNLQSVIFIYKEIVKAGVLPDVETLNYLIKVLCDSGHLNSAVNQFYRMNKKQCSPNSQTYQILITALCLGDRVDESVRILNQMLESSCSPCCEFYISIIPLLCRVNRLHEANKLLKMMKDSGLPLDLYLYSVLTECLCENRRLDDAIELFEEMLESGFAPMTSMYVDIVNAYCKLGKFSEAVSFLDENNTSEIEPYNALLQGYSDLAIFSEAIFYLEKMGERGLTDNHSWNIVIKGLCEKGNIGKAFEVLSKMIVSSYIPEDDTYSAIIAGYCKHCACENALDMFRQACASNRSVNAEACSELIEALCHAKKIQEAVEVLYYVTGKGHSLTSRSLNMLIQRLCEDGKVHDAIRLRSLASSNGTCCVPFTYATILVKILGLNKEKDILPFLSQMLVEGCTFDVTTYCILICGLCAKGMTREGAHLFDQMIQHNFVPDIETVEMLVFSMAKCSRLNLVAHRLVEVINIDKLLNPVLCNVIVRGLLKEGHKREACTFLDRMLEKGWIPDSDTHGLLVGNFDAVERDGTFEGCAVTGDDKVSSILVEGLEKSNEHVIEE